MNRREFLGSIVATGAVGAGMGKAAVPPPVVPQGAARLKVGLISDVHVTNKKPGLRDSNEHMLKALRYFDAQKVDAVLIAGDLFTSGGIDQLEIVAETWYTVFPNDTASDGRHVERLFITGNHDLDDWLYHKKPDETYDQCAARWKDRAFAFHRQETWKRLFNEDYTPYYIKTVKGYPFVMRHWPSTYHKEKTPIVEAFKKHGAELAKAKLFFYCQHDQPDNTVNASWLLGGKRWGNGQDDGLSTKVLSDYPNCVCLSGHNHNSLADERSIWQGAFTGVNCGCLVGWAFAGPGRENGHDCDSRPPVREMPIFSEMTNVYQGMVMTVYDNCITFHRREFVFGGVLGDDWVVPLGTKERPYAFAPRAAASKPPKFAAGAKVAVKTIEKGRDRAGHVHPQIDVSFPSVTSATGGDRAHDYSVRMEMMIGDVVRIVDEKRVFSDRFMFAEKDDRADVKCRFALSTVPPKRSVRFVVTPFNCWNKAGESIVSAWTTLRA